MKDFVIAVPKGRILRELRPLMLAAGIEPEPEFFDENSRRLQFSTNHMELSLITVRSFDVATFVAYGGADIGICGSDVLMEFEYDELYAPLDLGIGRCRLAVAEVKELAMQDNPAEWSHIRIGTKYVGAAVRHFAERGVQAECIKLNGSVELAPRLGLCRRIVDLVSTGKTLEENGLAEVEIIAAVSSRLIVNRAAFKTNHARIDKIISGFREAVSAKAA